MPLPNVLASGIGTFPFPDAPLLSRPTGTACLLFAVNNLDALNDTTATIGATPMTLFRADALSDPARNIRWFVFPTTAGDDVEVTLNSPGTPGNTSRGYAWWALDAVPTIASGVFVNAHPSPTATLDFNFPGATAAQLILGFAYANALNTTAICTATSGTTIARSSDGSSHAPHALSANGANGEVAGTWDSAREWYGTALLLDGPATGVDGSGTGTIGGVQADGDGTAPTQASGTGTIGAVQADGDGTAPTQGAGAATIGAPGILATGGGTAPTQGSGVAAIGSVQATGAGAPLVYPRSRPIIVTRARSHARVGVAAVAFVTMTYQPAPAAITGAGAGTIGGVGAVGTGTAPTAGSGTGTIGGVQADGDGTAPTQGAGASTIGGVAIVGAGGQDNSVNGAGAATIGGVQLDGDGNVPSSAGGAATIGAPSVAGAGNVPPTGGGAGTIGDVDAVGAGTAPTTGTLVSTLGGLTAVGRQVAPLPALPGIGSLLAGIKAALRSPLAALVLRTGSSVQAWQRTTTRTADAGAHERYVARATPAGFPMLLTAAEAEHVARVWGTDVVVDLEGFTVDAYNGAPITLVAGDVVKVYEGAHAGERFEVVGVRPVPALGVMRLALRTTIAVLVE